MKISIFLICTCLILLGFCGCSETSAAPDDSSIQNVSDEAAVEMIELEIRGNIISVPADIEDGDLLPGNDVYFDKVSVKSVEDILALFNEFGFNTEEGISFVTPEYWGAIAFIDGLWCVGKESRFFTEEVLYDETGIVSHFRADHVPEGETPPETSTIEHGFRDSEGRVYIDTDIFDIENRTDIDSFLELTDIFFGGYTPSLHYEFFTDDNYYCLKADFSNNYVILAEPLDTSGEYTAIKYEYGEDKDFICMTSYDHVGETCFRYFSTDKNGDTVETLYPEDGVVVETKVVNGVKTVLQQHTGGFYDYYYKSEWKEVFLTYDESGTRLIGYKAISLRDNEIYDWVLDGNGYEPENFVSVTITRNGSSKTYVGKDEIPWGAAIFYPSKQPWI